MKKEISYLIDEFISLSDELRPGYSLSIAKDKESSLILPESLNILYSKVSGTYYEIEDQRLMDFLPGYLLIRDAEYESFTQSVKEMIPNGEDKYYPILVNYSSDFYALKVSEGKENGIFLIEHDADGPTKIHHSFEDFLRTIIACYKYNRENETCNFQKRNEQNFSFFASFFLLLFRPLKDQLNAD